MKVFKTLAIICLGALLLGSCNPDGGEGDNTGLVLSVDKSYIYNNGGETEDGIANFTVTYNGKLLTDGYTIYHDIGYDLIPLDGNAFTSEEIDDFEFYATYGSERSNTIRILVTQTPPPAPDVPVDNNPANLNFAKRALLLQFTGTGCQFCPNMVNAIHTVREVWGYKDRTVVAAAHIGSYAGNDPARLDDAPTLDDAFGIASYPALIVNMVPGVISADPATVKAQIDNALNTTTVKGGIAVSAAYHPHNEVTNEKGFVVINTLVKAKESEEFRVGAWLLEDEVYGPQTVASSVVNEYKLNYNYHNNCIRRANSKHSDGNFSGFSLGTIEAGKTASKSFAFPLDAKWNTAKLRVVVFITTKKTINNRIYWTINNIIEAPINGVKDFDYNE